MSLEQIADQVIDTDVLVIGGGIAGCPVAAKAAEHGLRVTLLEKSKTDRSGSAAMGIDHYNPFPRDGVTVMDLVQAWAGWQSAMNGGVFMNPNIHYKLFDHAFWAVEELEKLGVTMKWYDGDYRFIPSHIGAAEKRIMLRVPWENVKPQMAKAVRKRGVNILERTVVIDLLTNNGTVVGATAVNMRTGEFFVIKSKATVISTGEFSRCYDPESPQIWKYKMRYHICPASVSGDGWAVAYRAGAELANMHNTSFGFRTRDCLTLSFGNLPNNEGLPCKTYTWNGEEVRFPNASSYTDLERKGLTPLYYSLEHLPDDYHKRIEVCTLEESPVSFKMATDRGFNPRAHRYEATLNRAYMFSALAGVLIDEDFRTSLPGLFAGGNSAAGFQGCGCAAISGLLIGDNIHGYVNTAGEPVVDEAQVQSQKNTALGPLAVKDGTEPMELEVTIRHICDRYVGQFKSEGKIREGLRRLGSLRREFLPQLMARTPHYLARCLEARSIIDLAEAHMHACLERKESRGGFVRLDFTEKAPSLDDMITVQRLENGRLVLEAREAPALRAECAREGN